MNPRTSVEPLSGNVLLSTPGMHEMAKDIHWILKRRSVGDNGGPAFDLSQVKLTAFPNGEHEPLITETMRGAQVFLLHPMQLPDPNAAFMNLMFTADALMRAAVGSIRLVLPYMSFLRQDRRKDNKRVPISAKVIANLIQSIDEIKQIITIDMHADQEVGFFNLPADNMSGSTVLVEDLKHRHPDFSRLIVVAPDVGSATRVRRIARKLSVPLAIIDKDRKGPGEAEVLGILGQSVKGMHAVLFDDMIDTGGTIINAANKLRDEGAESVEIYATHGLFSGTALEKFTAAQIPVRVTESIPRSEKFCAAHASWLGYVSIAPLLADAIYEASLVRGSLSKLSV